MHVPNSDQARRDEAQAPTNFGLLAPGLESPAAEVLVASHADYPSFRHVFRDPERRERALRSFFAATLRDATRSGVVRTAAQGSRLVR